MTTRWFCVQCKRAGLAADRVCCSNALLTACETDERKWYQLRVAAKPRDWSGEVMAIRWNPLRMLATVRREAERKGGRFVMVRAKRPAAVSRRAGQVGW